MRRIFSMAAAVSFLLAGCYVIAAPFVFNRIIHKQGWFAGGALALIGACWIYADFTQKDEDG